MNFLFFIFLLQRERYTSQTVLYLARYMVSLLIETSTPTFILATGIHRVYLLDSQAFVSPECIWYFLRSTCTGSHYRTQLKVCTVLSVRGTYSTKAWPAWVRGLWTFHCVLAIWGSILKQPCNLQIAGAAERRKKILRVVAVTQGCVIIPETRALVPNLSPFCQ